MTKESAAAIILNRIIREESLEYGDLSVQEIYALKKAYCVLCPEPQTNADRIRNMTNKELLNLLCLKHCPTAIDPAYKCKDIGNCKTCWEEWLKQEVNE